MNLFVHISDDTETADLEQQLCNDAADPLEVLIALDEFCIQEFGCTYIQIHAALKARLS